MSDIYAQSSPSAEDAFEISNYLQQRGFVVQTFGPEDTLTVDSRSMQDGTFARASNHYLVIGTK